LVFYVPVNALNLVETRDSRELTVVKLNFYIIRTYT
jgi:hypothetical protein